MESDLKHMSEKKTSKKSDSSIKSQPHLDKKLDDATFLKLNLKYILPIPILITLVFLNQMRLSSFDTLTSWKGGGFGMFSSISYRFFHLHLVDSSGFNCVEKPRHNNLQQKKMRNYPTYKNMSELATFFSSQKWMFKTKYVYGKKELSVEMVTKHNEKYWTPAGNVLFNKFEILVFDVKFNPETLELVPYSVKDLSINKILETYN